MTAKPSLASVGASARPFLTKTSELLSAGFHATPIVFSDGSICFAVSNAMSTGGNEPCPTM